MAMPYSSAIPVTPTIPQNGLMNIMGPGQLAAAEEKAKQDAANAVAPVTQEQATGLSGLIEREWQTMKTHRDSRDGWSNRLLSALRAFNGQYEPDKLAEIKKFGGSEIYARLIAVKCRGASSLLRDVYLTTDRPWGLNPPSDPEIPANIFQAVQTKVTSEVQNNHAAGVPSDIDGIRDRTLSLMKAARLAAKKMAKSRSTLAEDKLDTLLEEGGFYSALAEFLVDLPLFPFAVIKGPTVKVVPKVTWKNGSPLVKMIPKMTWGRVSPFDFWWTPGVSRIEDAATIERIRFTRAALNDCLDLPGYDKDEVRAVLQEYGQSGRTDVTDSTDSSRASLESRESPAWNNSGLIDCLEYHGNVQGCVLRDYGWDNKKVPDEMRDYAVQVWKIGTHIIKVQMAPSPRQRVPYFVTSFEKVPGTVVGNALPDMLQDLQEGANGALRAVMNNMAMASGPQVAINVDRVSAMDDIESMYPWKRWLFTSDPVNNSSTQKPVEFFQPQSNAQENLAIYQAFMAISDDISAIPRYLQGNSPGGGAGRTASGLAMLMGNASKILQTVAANVDNDVIRPLLMQLLDMVLLTDESDMLDGTENIVVKGVAVALQRETQRSRQLEFLQGTANPIDAQIIGPKGRAAVLRAVANTLGLPGEEIVPSDEEMDAQQAASAQAAQAAGDPGHGGMGDNAAQAQGAQPGAPSGDMGPRTNLVGQQGSRPGIAGGVG